MKGILVLITALVFSGTAAAEPRVRVIDGDGLEVGEVVIRLWGIDAPELDQTCELEGRTTPCGEDARFVLDALVAPGGLVCETKDTDRYGRTIAQCSVGGADLAGALVHQGYALDWPRYSGGHYAAQEAEARESGRGLWAGEFVKPWDWRKR
ncbi:MAG: thermonuclease family protein [Alphaproteobacteria bacterium]|nr:thermonuclease family protein [Alphaproteobacteria bacterium]